MKNLRPGIVIAIRCWWGEHWAIVAIRHGALSLISNRGIRGGVTEEPFPDVAGNRDWRVVGFLGSLPADAVVHRARSGVGSVYRFLTWNCQDFCFWAHGLEPKSPQREGLVAAIGFAGAAVLLSQFLKTR